VILVVIDRFTKYDHFFLVKHPYIAASIAQIFLDNMVKMHGVPQSIICDRDRVFTSPFGQNCSSYSKLISSLAQPTILKLMVKLNVSINVMRCILGVQFK
jgi:hypothetical protein